MASIRTGIELNDQFSSVLYGIINSVNMAVASMEEMSQTMNADISTTSIEAAREQLNQATIAADELNQAMQEIGSPSTPSAPVSTPTQTEPVQQPVQQPTQEPVQQPIQWQSDTLEVFDSSGVERYQQEIQSANSMLEQLSTTQDEIARQAANSTVLSPNAQRDMTSLATRIDNVRNRIQQIESNPMNLGTETANSELEQLRSQLNQAVQQQDELNQAMQEMDVSAANDAYMRLSQTVSNTERYIRDNTNEQGTFNQTIQEGTTQANTLMQTIQKAVAAYATVETVKSALNASDELIQTTSRLDMMNDGVQTTEDLVNMVYVAAQDARGSFNDMADVVARFGNNAKDAFSSSAEVVQFANLIQKQMTIAGASTQEAANAELQLSQALGSGVLRGDELNSIFEQAPNLIQNIADYMDVPIGKIREMASNGELSADIVKNAIFAATDDINANFDSMPQTWGQIWQSMQNTAVMAFQPVLQKINEVANSDGFQTFVNTAINDMAVLAGVVLNIFDIVGSVATFISDNWSAISPIIYGVITALTAYYAVMGIVKAVEMVSAGIKIALAVASFAHAAATGVEASATAIATAEQYGLNAALLSCPLTWIILLIIALIAVIVAVANYIANMGGTATTAFGVITGGVNVVIQFFKNLGLEVANIALGIGNAIAALGSNIMTAFHNAICSVQSWWYDLLSTVLSVIESICAALNKLPFVEFDYSGISEAADDYASKSAEAANNKQDYQSISDAYSEGSSTFDAYSKGWASDAYASGAKWGDGVSSKIKNMVSSTSTNIPSASDYSSALATSSNTTADNTAATAANTAKTADSATKAAKSLDITSEDLKYLRDIAERDVVNRFTTASINVNMTNNNTVNSDMDLDGVTEHLRSTIEEEMNAVAEGVH